MEKTTKGRIPEVLILAAIGVVLVSGSIAYVTSAYAQANNASSSAKNITFAAKNSTISSPGNMTRVLVTMEVKDGKKQEVLKSLISLAELARKRQGNINYDIYSLIENPNELVLDQLWSSKAAFDKHYNSPEATQYRHTLTPLLVNPAQVKVYAEVGKT